MSASGATTSAATPAAPTPMISDADMPCEPSAAGAGAGSGSTFGVGLGSSFDALSMKSNHPAFAGSPAAGVGSGLLSCAPAPYTPEPRSARARRGLRRRARRDRLGLAGRVRGRRLRKAHVGQPHPSFARCSQHEHALDVLELLELGRDGAGAERRRGVAVHGDDHVVHADRSEQGAVGVDALDVVPVVAARPVEAEPEPTRRRDAVPLLLSEAARLGRRRGLVVHVAAEEQAALGGRCARGLGRRLRFFEARHRQLLLSPRLRGPSGEHAFRAQLVLALEATRLRFAARRRRALEFSFDFGLVGERVSGRWLGLRLGRPVALPARRRRELRGHAHVRHGARPEHSLVDELELGVFGAAATITATSSSPRSPRPGHRRSCSLPGHRATAE